MTVFGGGYLPGEEAASRVFIERHKVLFALGERLLRLAFSFKPELAMRRDEVQFFQAVIGLPVFRLIHPPLFTIIHPPVPRPA